VKRILVVDDSVLIREVARVALESAGHEVVAAESGERALAEAASERPDAILLDVVMPDMDGPATLAALRDQAHTADVPVVLVTGREEIGRDDDAHGLDVAGVIAKPFDASTLPGEVAGILGWDR